MTEFWILVNFRKYTEYTSGCNYGRVLDVPGFRLCQASAYMQALHKVLNMPEYDWIIPQGRALNMPGQPFMGSKYATARNMARLWLCEDYTGRFKSEKPEYPLIMSQYAWTCFYNAKYD